MESVWNSGYTDFHLYNDMKWGIPDKKHMPSTAHTNQL